MVNKNKQYIYMYCLYVNNYLKLSTEILKITNTKINILLEIENYINDFIYSMEGINKYDIVKEPSSLKSITWNKYKYGYIVTKSKDSIEDYVIYNKSIDAGYLYNSYKITKVLYIGYLKYNYKEPIDVLLENKEIIESRNKHKEYFDNNIKKYITNTMKDTHYL